MTIKEIYEKFDNIGCVSFSTLDNDKLESRIAHFFAYDDDGIYLRTMEVKPMYRQMKRHGKLSASGIYPEAKVRHTEDNLPLFEPGYTIRISGEVKELTAEQINEKAKTNTDFYVAVYDVQKYPSIRVFVLHRAHGELYDYDFEMAHREHKILRQPFAYGGDVPEVAGFEIADNCIACGACYDNCSFKAIEKGVTYSINKSRCDECGNCTYVCPVSAIIIRDN